LEEERGKRGGEGKTGEEEKRAKGGEREGRGKVGSDKGFPSKWQAWVGLCSPSLSLNIPKTSVVRL